MKLLRTAVALILITALFPFCAIASAAGLTSLKIAQSVQKGNNIKIYFNAMDDASAPAGSLLADDLFLSLGSDTLSIESVSPFDTLGEGIGYVFAVDISKSLTNTQFTAVRESLKNLINNMGALDMAAILTFGEEVGILSDFSQDKDALNVAASQMAPTADKTQLYKAISSAVMLASRQDSPLPDRRVIVILTDGVDDAPGGWSKDEALADLQKSHIPLYSVGISNGSTAVVQALNDLGSMCRTSGGEIYVTGADSIQTTYQQVFDRIGSASMLTAVLPDTVLDGESRHLQLVIELDGRKVTDSMEFRAVPIAGAVSSASPSAAAAPPPSPLQEVSAEPAASQPPAQSSGSMTQQTLIIIGAAVILAAAAAVLFLVLRKKKTDGVFAEECSMSAPREDASVPAASFDHTVGLYDYDQSDGKTVALIKKSPYTITLTERRDNFEKKHTLPLSDELIIGRTGGGGTLPIDDNSVSGRHCRIVLKPGGLFITDLESKNRTKVNGEFIVPNKETLISNGAILTLGRTTLKITLSVSGK